MIAHQAHGSHAESAGTVEGEGEQPGAVALTALAGSNVVRNMPAPDGELGSEDGAEARDPENLVAADEPEGELPDLRGLAVVMLGAEGELSEIVGDFGVDEMGSVGVAFFAGRPILLHHRYQGGRKLAGRLN